MYVGKKYICKLISIKLFIFIVFLFLLSGCGINKSRINPMGNATPSSFPSADWKYGYYCGEGHPSTPDYNQKPKDDIDSACRNHDICWENYGKNSGPCNDEFLNKIEYLSNSFMNEKKNYGKLMEIASYNIKIPQVKILHNKWEHTLRCQNVTGDIILAFTSIAVPSEYVTNNNIKLDDRVYKSLYTAMLFLPLTILETLSRTTILNRNYPDTNETCNAALSNYSTYAEVNINLINNNCWPQDFYINNQKFTTIAANSSQSLKVSPGTYTTKACAVGSLSNCGQPSSVTWAERAVTHTLNRNPSCAGWK